MTSSNVRSSEYSKDSTIHLLYILDQTLNFIRLSLNNAISEIPADLTIYTDESVQALNDTVNGMNKDLDIRYQKKRANRIVRRTYKNDCPTIKGNHYKKIYDSYYLYEYISYVPRCNEDYWCRYYLRK